MMLDDSGYANGVNDVIQDEVRRRPPRRTAHARGGDASLGWRRDTFCAYLN